MNKRYKNYGLWISISSLIFLFLQDTGIQITPEKFDVYVNMILGILILLGIINNPETKNKGFGDDA